MEMEGGEIEEGEEETGVKGIEGVGEGQEKCLCRRGGGWEREKLWDEYAYERGRGRESEVWMGWYWC